MKLYITGGPGCGKTTYANYLAKKFNIPCLGLDSVKWKKNTDKAFTKYRSRERRKVILRAFVKNNKNWICEGAYNQDWANSILKNADVVLIIYAPVMIRNYRCIKRALFEEDRKKLSWHALWKLLVWSYKYDKYYLPELKEKLDKFGVKYIVVNSKFIRLK